MNPKVDFYFNKDGTWQQEIRLLRDILIDCHLSETLKWGVPTYTYKNSNVVLIHVFKAYCALLFFKGSLLKDEEKRLIQQTQNVQAARQLRFTTLAEIADSKSRIQEYILEACKLEESGEKVKLKSPSQFEMVKEFEGKLSSDLLLKEAFYALTPGRQRAYLLHFSGAKLGTTRSARVAKQIPQIMAGKGLNDL